MCREEMQSNKNIVKLTPHMQQKAVTQLLSSKPMHNFHIHKSKRILTILRLREGLFLFPQML